ncbi:MAG: glycosyltransferase family A protein [Candidatus Sulfotelmatobacter sp.]
MTSSAENSTAQPWVSGPLVSWPLVSCIMVTRDRPEFVLQSIQYFFRQDYPNRELIIVDDGSCDLASVVTGIEHVRYHRAPGGMSIGEKRNLACDLAQGEYIAQWDDDDWYSPRRLSIQLAPLLAGPADISAFTAGVFFELPRWRFWRCSPKVHRCMFVGNVHCGTLVFRRKLYDQGLRYRSLSLAEDAHLLCDAKRGGSRVCRLSGDDSFVYLRHANNAWQFTCGEHIDARGWSEVPIPEVLAADCKFYEERALSLK